MRLLVCHLRGHVCVCMRVRKILLKGGGKVATEQDTKGIYPTLKGKKRKFAEKLVSPEFDGNISGLCAEMGVARSTYYRWCDDSDFNRYIEYLIEKYTESELANVWRSLISKAKGGSVEAIRLYFELKGKYNQKVTVNGGVVFLAGDDEIAE